MNTESEIELLKIGIQKLQKQNEFIHKQNEYLQKQNEKLQKEFNDLQKEIGIIKAQTENFQKEIKETIEYLTEKRKEQYYQRYLEKLFSAKHKKNKHGITDITTDTQIIEIKHWKAYKSALGQLISYKQSDSEKLLEVYFFGTYNKNKDSIIELFKQNNISVYELADTPTGIQINEIYKYNHNSLKETDDFFNWLTTNIEYSSNETDYIDLKTICELYLGKSNIHSSQANKYKKEVENWIKKYHSSVNSEYRRLTIDNLRPRGWANLKIINKFKNWLNTNIEHKDGSLLQLKDVCELFLNKTNIHSSESTKFRKEIENWIKEKSPGSNWNFQKVWTNGKTLKGWKNLRIIDKPTN